MRNFSKRLNELITSRDMTTKEFAEKYDLPVATLYDLSQDKRSPSPKVFFDIVNNASVNPDYLLCPYIESDKRILVWELLDLLDEMAPEEYRESVEAIEFLVKLLPRYKKEAAL